MVATIATSRVKVKNATYEDLGDTNLDRALFLVLTDQADIEEADPERLVRTANGEVYEFPLSIVMTRVVEVQRVWGEVAFAPNKVPKRDKYTCAYCGKYGDTHDHIVPKSKGGEDSWLNSVTACKKCNGKKDNRTPAEANMPLRYTPTVPHQWHFKSKTKRRPRKHRV